MGALENLISVITPVICATLYACFMNRQPGVSANASTLALILGPGGHFILAAVFRLLSSLVLSTTDDKLLFIDS